MGIRAKLALMRIVHNMAIPAQELRHGAGEVSSLVAACAGDGGVFASEWKFCSGVVEADKAGNLFPAAGGMARLAAASEGPAVRVLVTGIAGVKSQSSELRGELRPGLLVAGLARYLHVQASQCKLCFAVVKTRRLIPAFEGVASQAIITQLAAMLILMTSNARRSETKECAVGVLYSDRPEFL
jgi:hypothetical protein